MVDRTSSPGHLMAWALVALAIVYAVGAGGAGSNGINETWGRIVGTAAVVIAVAAWLLAAARGPFWRPRSELTLAFGAALASLVISLLGSTQPRVGVDYIAYAVLLVGGYLLLQRLFAHPFFGPRLGTLSVLLGLGLSAIYIAVVAVKWVVLWIQLGHVVSPPLRPGFESLGLADPSGLAAVLLLLFLASACHLGLSTRTRTWVLLTQAAITSTAIFLTGSRSAWLALAAAIVTVGALWAWDRDRRGALLAAIRHPLARRLGAIAAVAVLVAVVVFSRGVASRLGEPAGDTRTAFAQASLAMFRDDPLTGVGPGMWVVDRIQYTQPPDVDYYIPHAHNLILQTLAELGLVSAASGVVVSFLLLRLVLKGLRAADALVRRLAWATLFGAVFLVVHQMFGLYANMPALWLCYALVVARLDALLTVERPPMSNRVFAPVGVGLAVAFAGAALWLGFSERAALVNDTAVRAANAGDWQIAEANARESYEQDPGMPPYAFTLGLAEAHTGQQAAALAHLRASAEVDDFPVAWLDVARLELDLGDEAAGRSALDAAMRLGYQHPQIAFAASQMYVELGDEPAAVSALAAALVVAPTLASDPWWDQTGQRPLLEAALDTAIPSATPDVAYRLALEGKRTDTAATLVANMPAEARAIPDLVVRAWGGDAAAFNAVHAMAIDNPLDTDTVVLCRRLALHSANDLPLDNPWVCDGAGAPDSPIVIRIGVSDYGEWAPVPGLPGPDASVQVIYVYRRLAPLDKLVPGIVAVVPRFK